MQVHLRGTVGTVIAVFGLLLVLLMSGRLFLRVGFVGIAVVLLKMVVEVLRPLVIVFLALTVIRGLLLKPGMFRGLAGMGLVAVLVMSLVLIGILFLLVFLLLVALLLPVVVMVLRGLPFLVLVCTFSIRPCRFVIAFLMLGVGRLVRRHV